MFTGIIESAGIIKGIEKEGTNIHLRVESNLAQELKIDQSLAHDGVCLTVVAIEDQEYVVTAIEETLVRTNLEHKKVGDLLNLERAMSPTGRLDGHIVQGHVDTTGKCVKIEQADGSWYFTFKYDITPEHILVDKGSVCINGVSLTVVSPTKEGEFSVAIIPYTYEHTNFHKLTIGDTINLEFDILGKYIARYMEIYQK